MADHTERFVTLYDLGIAPKGVHGRPFSERTPEDFRPLRDAVKAAAAAKKMLCDQPDSNGRRLYLMDMEVYEKKKYMVLVWTLTDPNTAAQMYLSRSQLALRPAAKNDDEDVAVSSHMVVDFDVPQNSTRYPIALEDHEGIPRWRVQKVFQELLQNHMPVVSVVVGDGIEKSNPPKIYMDARPGRVMQKTDLKPVEIEVVKLTPRKVMIADSADPYVEASERRVFKLVREGVLAEIRDEAVAFVKKLRKKNPNHTIRVRWRDPDNPSDSEVTKLDPLDERPERLLERALTRTVHLSGFRGLHDATDKIVTRLADRMLEALREVVSEDARR
jgi:hypothetical protein